MGVLRLRLLMLTHCHCQGQDPDPDPDRQIHSWRFEPAQWDMSDMLFKTVLCVYVLIKALLGPCWMG